MPGEKTCVINNPRKYFPKKRNRQLKDVTKSKIEVEPVVKGNILANLIHKNSFGANNWHTFIKLQSGNSTKIQMDCSEEYTTMETIPPAKPNSGSNSSTRTKSTTKINETNTNNSNAKKQMNKVVKPKDKPSDKLHPIPSKRGSNQPKKSLNKPIENRNKPPLKRNSDKNGITDQIAIDCEMVGVEVGVKKDMLARVSIVNSHGKCIYDTFVKPVEPVINYRTHVSGVRPEDLINAPDFATVQKKVADILKDRVLVGHGLKKDLAVLLLSHPRNLTRDTTKFHKFYRKSTPSLKKLAKEYLGVSIQEGEHNSVQDALAAMQLYKMFRTEWEASLKKRKRHVKVKQAINLQATVTEAMSLMDV